MDLCKKENNGKKKKISLKKEEKPSWYNRELDEEVASEEDIKKLEEKLKNYR